MNASVSSPPQPDGGEDLFCHVSAIMDGNTLREGDTVQFVKVFDEKRGKERAEDITGGVTADGDAPRARFNDQVCFDFMKGRCGPPRPYLHIEALVA